MVVQSYDKGYVYGDTKMRLMLITIVLIVYTTACATKRYGRMLKLTDYGKEVYECDDIGLELAKLAGFRKEIIKTANFQMPLS